MPLTLKQRLRGYWLYWRHNFIDQKGRRREALTRFWSGDLDAARHMLIRDQRPSSRLELACLELVAGDAGAASRWLHELPEDPARDVLARLIELHPGAGPYRGAGPTWLAALEDAWSRAGSPDLASSTLVSQDFHRSYDPGRWRHCPDEDSCFVWEWLNTTLGVLGPKRSAALRAWAREGHATGVPERVVALHIIEGANAGVERAPDRIAAYERLCKVLPNSLWAQLGLFVARRGETYGPDDLRELERLVDVPDVYGLVSPAIHSRFLEVARASRSASPEPLAFFATLRTPLMYGVAQLIKRLLLGETTRAAGTLGVRLGRRLREDRFVVSWVYGNSFMKKGASICDDRKANNELAAENAERAEIGQVNKKPILEPLYWPVPALVHEVIRVTLDNELAYRKRRFRIEQAARAASALR